MRIRAEKLSKTYFVGSSRIAAVDNVDLDVGNLPFTAVVGRSGSGKSTLLNLLGLNDIPTSGRVIIDDTDAMSLPSRRRRSVRLHRMGFVFQSFNLIPTLSATENVELPMALAGKPLEEQRSQALELLETVGLGQRISHRPRQLSMGEMQRVAIARALANNPEIIIADEPTGELDSKTAREIVTLLHDITRKEKTQVVVATHDEKVVDVADKNYTIEDGKLKPGS